MRIVIDESEKDCLALSSSYLSLYDVFSGCKWSLVVLQPSIQLCGDSERSKRSPKAGKVRERSL